MQCVPSLLSPLESLTEASDKEASKDEELLILKVNLSTSHPDAYRSALVADFGSVNNYSEMKDDRLLVGPLGITGMIEKVFDPLLDELPLDHPWYTELYNLFMEFASLLGRRLTNYKKVRIFVSVLLKTLSLTICSILESF